ncbi:hypothetical protein [Acidovorax sp.]|uniref:hypothetical protein n=1 Tax=Acidovorax sp. TaxID=1872122 RepID=UPI0025C2E355|nr:hypothetical protein [Acidovorax sp.]MCI5068933.1 hypothetical protein [Acidovorax sp.]
MMSTRSVFRPGWRSQRIAQGAGAALLALLMTGMSAQAAGPVGPVGPVGPIGPLGPGPGGVEPEVPRPGRPLPVPRPAAPPKPKASSPSAGNRIEVSGNTASGTRCAQDGTASVNSVDVSGARLEGRTVIVQGRNANNVRTIDCPERTGQPSQGQGAAGQPPSNTNSIRIR